jgi:hypothetical protein
MTAPNPHTSRLPIVQLLMKFSTTASDPRQGDAHESTTIPDSIVHSENRFMVFPSELPVRRASALHMAGLRRRITTNRALGVD